LDLSDVAEVSTNGSYSLALKSDGTVWGWGSNSFSQVGDGQTYYRSTPALIDNGLTGIVSVSAGDQFSLALKSDGKVWAWGNNSFGQLGNGTTTRSQTPVEVSIPNNINIIEISTKYSYSLALASDGTVWSWGRNYYGQLGDGSKTNRSTPVPVSGLTGIIAISAGGAHGLALDSYGTVWSWGGNYVGQLGNGTTTNSLTPVKVKNLPAGIKMISAGGCHSLAIDSDGKVWAWGDNGYGQYGDGTTDSSMSPVQESILENITAVSAGDLHSLAVDSDGRLWAWGCNDYGEIGNGTMTDQLTPTMVMDDAVRISAGIYHSVATKSDGSVWAWGLNVDRELGDGTTTDELSPVQSSGVRGVTSISAGGAHNLAMNSNQSILGWGDSSLGQLAIPYVPSYLSPIQSYVNPDDYSGECFLAQVNVLSPTDSFKVNGSINGKFVKNCFAVKPDDDITANIALTVTDPNVQIAVYDDSLNLLSESKSDDINMLQGRVYYIRISYDPLARYSAASYTITASGSGIAPQANPSHLAISSTPGRAYIIAVNAQNMASFAGQTFTITYDPSAIRLVNLAAQYNGERIINGDIPGAGIKIISRNNGIVTFSVNKTIPGGMVWSGTVTMLKFEGITAGVTKISVQ